MAFKMPTLLFVVLFSITLNAQELSNPLMENDSSSKSTSPDSTATDTNTNSENKTTKTDKPTSEQVSALQAKSEWDNLSSIFTAAGVSTTAIKPIYDILQKIVDDKNVDANSVWIGAKAIQKVFSILDYKEKKLINERYNSKRDITELSKCIIHGNDRVEDTSCLLERVRTLTQQLIHLSYQDSLHYNKNLSSIIKIRFSELVKEAAYVIKALDENKKDPRIGYEYTANNFLEEFELFSYRYANTNRFVGGIGLTYSYIPQIYYNAQTRVDLSEFMYDITGGADRLSYIGQFSNKGYLSASFRADMEWGSIIAKFPKYSQEFETSLPVRYRERLGIDGDLFYRTNIKSTLDIDYDISFYLSVWNILKSLNLGTELTPQTDIRIGVGLIGMDVKHSFSHDIRIRPVDDITKSYSELTSVSTLTDNQQNSFITRYAALSYDAFLADSLLASITFKYHFDKNDGNDENNVLINGFSVEGSTIALEFHWFPFD